MTDLAMPDDDGSAAIVVDENGEPNSPARRVKKIHDIRAIFEKVAKPDKKLKDTKGKLAEPKKLTERALKTTQKQVEKLEMELANELRQIDFTPQTRNRMINKLKDIDNELSQCSSMIRKDEAALKREKDKTRRDFYRRRLQKYQERLAELETFYGTSHPELKTTIREIRQGEEEADQAKVRKIMKIAQEPISLETPIGEEEDSHLGDFIEDRGVISPIDHVIVANLKEQTGKVLRTLTPREEQVLKMRFGVGDGAEHTLEEVGRSFNVTRERIRQIESKALRKLRHPSRSKKLRPFLDSTF